MSQNTRVIFQETPRDFRTETPNIVFELLQAGEISANALTLYMVYRRIAGEHGACWVGKKGLEKRCALNHKTITKSKKILASPFKLLNGKSLIEISSGDYAAGEADTITIIDIWPENFAFFKKCLPDPNEPRGGSKRAIGGVQTSHRKKEPFKKEPYKNIIAPTPHEQKRTPAGGNNNFFVFFKCLEICKDLSDRQKQLLMKYPEHLVEQAVRYCYHPTTQVKGGPVGRIKLLQYFLQNPDDFKEQIKNLDNPRERKSKKDILLGAFKRGELYNGYEFLQDDVGVGFYKIGMRQPYSVNWNVLNFASEFIKLLEKLNIKYE